MFLLNERTRLYFQKKYFFPSIFLSGDQLVKVHEISQQTMSPRENFQCQAQPFRIFAQLRLPIEAEHRCERYFFLPFFSLSISLSFSSDLFALKIFLFLENENCSASILVRLTDGSMDVNGFVVVEIYRIREIVFTDEQAWPFDNSFFARGNNRSRNQARFISLVAINQSPR